MPAEVTKCFEGQPGKYGRDLISTAGYMLKGIDSVDISSCAAISAPRGFDPLRIVDLVRNPNYKQATDPTRQNYPTRCSSSSTPTRRHRNKVDAGQLDMWTGAFRRRC